MMKRRNLRWAILGLLLAAGIFLAGCQIDYQSVAVLFVGHGEPAAYTDGLEAIHLPGNEPFGPFGQNLNVPAGMQNTLWAMLFEEVAEAVAYMAGDLDRDGKPHEPYYPPAGDLPPGFRWSLFTGAAKDQYDNLGGSPHNAAWVEHVKNIKLSLLNKEIDVHLAYMDAQPLIAEKVYELTHNYRYDKLVVVPLLLSESTHTQEIRAEVAHWVGKAGRPIEVVWAHPFFTEPYVRNLHAKAVAAMVQWIRETKIPAEITKDQIGIVLASHGDPFPPPYAEFGWKPGDIYSHVYLMEKDFRDTVANLMPYDDQYVILANNEFRPPSVDQAVTELMAAGKTHIIVVPANFPTPSMHTMWDIPEAASGLTDGDFHGVTTAEIASWRREADNTSATVYYSSHGYGDLEPGATYVRDGMRYVVEVALLELFEKHRAEYEYLFK